MDVPGPTPIAPRATPEQSLDLIQDNCWPSGEMIQGPVSVNTALILTIALLLSTALLTTDLCIIATDLHISTDH